MDDLRAEFERLRARRGRGRLAALRQFQGKLGGMTLFDPACGCGNFLIIAYRELRLLEIEVIREIRDETAATTQTVLDTAWQSVVDVDQFYGIELGEFPARIAETALWMMDHVMNNRLSLEFGQSFVRIPLEKSPHIAHGDALEADWSVCCRRARVRSCWAIRRSWARSTRHRSSARRCAGSPRSARAAARSITSARGSSRRGSM